MPRAAAGQTVCVGAHARFASLMFAQRLALMWPPCSTCSVHFSPGLDVVDALLAALDDAEEPREAVHFIPGPQRGGRVEALRLEAGTAIAKPRSAYFRGGVS